VQKNEKNLVGLLELETAILECFLKKTPLSPLGVKDEVLQLTIEGCYDVIIIYKPKNIIINAILHRTDQNVLEPVLRPSIGS
jgi:hypothetical protein